MCVKYVLDSISMFETGGLVSVGAKGAVAPTDWKIHKWYRMLAVFNPKNPVYKF